MAGPSNDKLKILVVQGPTASGKTGLSIRLAEKFGGEVVNADSVQWLRYFDIGSAKPSLLELSMVPHHLIGTADPDKPTDVGVYLERAREIISVISEKGKVPVVAGGTGLYVRALLRGLVDLPARDDELRASYDAILERGGAEALFAELEAKAPDAEAYIDRHNPPRIVRALEVLDLTGRNIWEWQKEHAFADRPYHVFAIAIQPDMDKLKERIGLRTDQMLEAGLIEEVKELLNRFPDRSLKAYGAIGYKEVISFLDGELTEAELPAAIRKATYRYAKKQLTWLRKEPDLHWFSSDTDEENVLYSLISEFLSDVQN